MRVIFTINQMFRVVALKKKMFLSNKENTLTTRIMLRLRII